MRQYISLICITWLRLIVDNELGLIKINKIRRDQLLLILDIYVDTYRSIINIPASLQLGEEPLAVTKFETLCFIFPLNAGKVLPIILYWFQSQHMEICKIYNRLKSMHALKVITNNFDSRAIWRSWFLSLNTTTYDFVSAGLAYLLF